MSFVRSAARVITRRTLVQSVAWPRTRVNVAPIALKPVNVILSSIRPITTSHVASSQYEIANLSMEEYHRLSDRTMDNMVEILESIGDETDLSGFDVEYAQGVMTLKLGANGTYVINKQPPNKQIWLSSPKSGPKRYDYDIKHHKWFYHRDNHTLDELLNEELSEILQKEVNLLEGMEQN
ncbi:Mitochondrial chaperone Frataxin [Apophysomyces ossiformis]|uniref:ferroxidase n=1 Tax=Apophysomyces ossiformis TaxID=679940 RepID=A0A8H7EMW9_9FUNG|nr:Mitochondrial chaperone Frataxin [Apophysomyces ossiformis]